MKKCFLVCVSIFSSFGLIAQIASFEGNKSTSSVLLQKAIPPSPTAASLGKYGDQQINMFTGNSAVNIPIYEIKTNGYSIPLSLGYSSSGLRVTEAASWVGLGWSVRGTGVVTRVVKGMPDGPRKPIDIKIWPLPLAYSYIKDDSWGYIHPGLLNGTIDSEPDMFIVSAGKLNVKFYFDLHKRIQTIPYNNDVKIRYDEGLDTYTITDVDGAQYFFGGISSSEITNSSNPSYAAYTSSWFLTKIITPVGAEILYNNSKGTNSMTQDQYSESEEVKPNGQSGNCGAAAGRTTQWNVQEFQPVFLNTIETDKEIVYLTRDVTERADMPGDFALTGIKVYSKSSQKYEYNFSFIYSYFPQVSTTCWGYNGGINLHPHSYTAICKRLRLDQFIEKGFEGNTSGFKAHHFQYSSKAVPARCSLDQDFWGYYNGAGNTSLLPPVTDPEFQGSTFNAMSRDANADYGDAGMLQKIIYPTGGETNFLYESNEITSFVTDGSYQTVTASLSGISPSFEASVNFTLSSMQWVTLNFTLSDPNLLDQGLQRKVEIIDQIGNIRYMDMNSNTPVEGIPVSGNAHNGLGAFQAGTYTLKISRNYSYSSYPSIPAIGLIASVTYKPTGTATMTNRKLAGFRIKKVVDKTDPSGTEVNVKEFSYDYPYLIADIKNSDCVSSYNRWTYFVPAFFLQCSYKSRNTTSVQPMGSIQGSSIGYGKVTCLYGLNGSNGRSEFFYSTDHDMGGYSLHPIYRPITSYDHRRGNLLSQKDYDASGKMLRTVTNVYEYVLKYAGLFSFPFYSKDQPVPDATTGPSLLPSKEISFADFALPSEWIKVKNSTETIFDGPSYISAIKEFSYDNPNYSYTTQTKTTNSKGNVITEINKYPLDFKPTTPYSNEEIERNFDTDYQTLFNNFVTCNNAASATDAAAINACYATYQSAYDNLLNSRAAALANYQSTFTTLANGTADPILKAKYQLIAKNKIAELIESRVTKNVSTELSKTTNDFKDFSGNILLEKVNKSVSGNALETEITVNSYDNYGNILQATPKDGVIKSYIWDYQNKLPIAEVSNASISNIAYTSFEADGKGSWTFSGTPVIDGSSPTGAKAYNLSSGTITKAITSSNTYIISYWRPTSLSALTITGTQPDYPLAGRTVKGWKYYEHKITGQTTATISGSGLIDELRLCPSNALMSTSTYDPLKGLTSRCDPTSRIAYYDYDVFGRLILIRDQDRNILKKISYNYAGLPEDISIFVNAQKEGTYAKNDCAGCQMGSSITYTVQAGLYSSTLSQADADNKAQAEVIANGQAYANSNGTCSAPVSAPLTGTNAISTKSFIVVFHNNCTGVDYTYTLNPSTVNVALSPQPLTGNYNVSFTPTGGTGTYLYIVNGFSQYTTLGNILGVDIIASGNQVRIQP